MTSKAVFVNSVIKKIRIYDDLYVFEMRNPFLTLLLSYHACVTVKIQINFRYRRYLTALMIVSYEFLKFLHYLCFRGEESISDILTELPRFGDLENPGQLPVQEVLGGTDDGVL